MIRVNWRTVGQLGFEKAMTMPFTQICPLCGATNSIDNEFCGSCRVYLGWDHDSGITADHTDLLDADTDGDYPMPGQRPGNSEPPQRNGDWNRYNARQHDGAVSGSLTSLPPIGPDLVTAAPATRTLLDSDPHRLCPQCSTRNDATLRFCRRCGSTLTRTPQTTATTTQPTATPWWRRWIPSDSEEKDARRAYRHSLPMRYRAQRILAGILVVAGIGAGSTLLGHNPAAWIKDRWADLQNTLILISDVQAVTEPADAAVADFPATAAVDNRADTAWATTWTNSTAPPTSCQAPSVTPAAGSTGSLLLLLSQPATVRAISILPGLPDNDPRRIHQWRPKTLQVGFSDGECQQVTLTDSPELQQLDLTPTATAALRISVVDTFAASPDQPSDLVAISEVRLLSRP